MKKLILLSVLTLLFTTGCVSWGQRCAVATNTNTYTATVYAGKTITGIDAGSAFNITLRQGSDTKVTYTIPDRYKDYFVCDLSAGTLHLSWKQTNINLNHDERLLVSIVCSSLENVKLHGACDLRLENNATCAGNFLMELSGASEFKSDNTLSIDGSSSRFKLSGASELRTNLNIKGGAAFQLSGACDVKSQLNATNAVTISSSGASELEFSGSAPSLQVDVSGSADVNAENFAVETATIQTSGASEIRLNVSKTLNAQASGASEIRYRGHPTVSMKASGASDIKPIN